MSDCVCVLLVSMGECIHGCNVQVSSVRGWFEGVVYLIW